MSWETIIGLEVHTQLKTQSKLFSGSKTQYGAEANSQASAIDLALPGTLPVFNHEALILAIRFGISIDAEINHESVFARKNYFYPDLSKGYQISQLDQPIVKGGQLLIELPNQEKKAINITRAHLEEDAGKSIHDGLNQSSGIDYNRAGTPLLEIVSEPELNSAIEAVSYLKTLHQLVCYLKISDGNMQEGSFRCDVNLSVRKKGSSVLGTRTELKNINSFRFVEQAIAYEEARQIDILESGGTITQETRQYDANKNITRPMRNKEDAFDYRYFPDPDLLPIKVTDDMINSISNDMPELPKDKYSRYTEVFQLSHNDAMLLTQTIDTALFFEATLEAMTTADAKLAANWINGELTALLNKNNSSLANPPIAVEQFARLLERIQDNTLSNTLAKTVLPRLINNHDTVDEIIEKEGLQQITDVDAIATIIDDILNHHPKQVQQYQAGKEKLLGFFVGKIMQATKGKANPSDVNNLLLERLSKT